MKNNRGKKDRGNKQSSKERPKPIFRIERVPRNSTRRIDQRSQSPIRNQNAGQFYDFGAM